MTTTNTATSPKPQPPSTRGMRFPVEVLTRSEVRALLDTFSRRAPSGVRNRALVTVLYRAGLRCGEALALEVRDVELQSGSVTVRCGKGGKRRVVGLDGSALDAVERWVQHRARLGAGNRGVLFCQVETGRVGLPLDPSYCRKMDTRHGRRAGIEKRVHPHGFRHTLLSELAMEGVPLPTVSAVAGHASCATTDVYLRRVAAPEVVAAMQSRPEW